VADRETSCACKRNDPYDCWRLRYPRRSEDDDEHTSVRMEGGPCECPCHDEFACEDEGGLVLMVAYSFKKQFGPPILAGTKAQTIRAERAGRSRHARPGELVQLYTGMRTRQCTKLGESKCIAVWPIELHLGVGIVFANDGWIRTGEDLDAFARQDGFRGWPEMVAFWKVEHPDAVVFEGILIRWQPLARTAALEIAGAA